MCKPKSALSSQKGEQEAQKGLELGLDAVDVALICVENDDTIRRSRADSGFNMGFSTAC